MIMSASLIALATQLFWSQVLIHMLKLWLSIYFSYLLYNMCVIRNSTKNFVLEVRLESLSKRGPTHLSESGKFDFWRERYFWGKLFWGHLERTPWKSTLSAFQAGADPGFFKRGGAHIKGLQNFGACGDGGVWGDVPPHKRRKIAIFKINSHDLVHSFYLGHPHKVRRLISARKKRGRVPGAPPSKSAPVSGMEEQVIILEGRVVFRSNLSSKSNLRTNLLIHLTQ